MMNKRFLQTIGFGALSLGLMTSQTWAMEKEEKIEFSVTQVTVNSKVVPEFAVSIFASDKMDMKGRYINLYESGESEPLMVKKWYYINKRARRL